jgi:hypothetical protein
MAQRTGVVAGLFPQVAGSGRHKVACLFAGSRREQQAGNGANCRTSD